ncbi:hypothetical protein LUCX_75 [Xanthomonas phage vB_XciM_LucasX]|nr:hypothetical protein LUCX_75 [Xanthomonas phage vB_XciM_LucasX]
MAILDFYKQLIESVGGVIGEEGLISLRRPEDEPQPFMVTGKRLALPLPALLNQGAFNADGQVIAFHPICENVVLKTSPVLEKFELAMTFRLTYVLRELIMQLTAVAADPKQHKKLKMRAQGLLSAMPDADEKTREAFFKILKNTTSVGDHPLISLYVRQGGGLYNGEKVNRLARFYPAVVRELERGDRTIYGVKLRQADEAAFQALIEYILPEYRDDDHYSSPSNSLVAPSFHALIKTYYKVANQLNKITEMYAEQLTNADELRIPTDWIEDAQDLGQFREKIPVLPGNDGADGAKQVRVQPQAAMGATATPATTPAAPVRQSGKGLSIDEALKLAQPKPPAFGGQQQSFGRGNRFGQQAPQDDLPPWAQSSVQNTFASRGGGWGRGGGGGGWGGRGGGVL